MGKFKIEIDTNNSAFEDNKVIEIRRIITEAMERFEDNGEVIQSLTLRDINGNKCGTLDYIR